jgi:hypothetical protein
MEHATLHTYAQVTVGKFFCLHMHIHTYVKVHIHMHKIRWPAIRFKNLIWEI